MVHLVQIIPAFGFGATCISGTSLALEQFVEITLATDWKLVQKCPRDVIRRIFLCPIEGGDISSSGPMLLVATKKGKAGE